MTNIDSLPSGCTQVVYGGNVNYANSSTSATKATQDESGNNIKSSYASSISINDHTITLSNKNGTSLGTVTVPDNNTVTTATTTGSGNAVTSITASNGALTVTKGSTFLTAHPTISTSTDTTSTASPAHGGTFTAVDSITRDSNGHVTKVNTKTITLPTDNNTDTKVTQTVTTSNASYPLLLAPSGQTATATTTSYFDSGVTLNPSTNTIAANISGNATTATTATKLGSSTIGSGIRPIYLNAGTATVSSSTVGSTQRPVYMSTGTITQCGYSLYPISDTYTSEIVNTTVFSQKGAYDMYTELNSNFGNLVFSQLSLGQMPGSVGVAQKIKLPDGYTNDNTFIVAVRILRNSGQYVYTDVGGGGFCSIYIDNNQYVNLVATSDGVTYCANQAVGVIIAKAV